MVSVTTKGWNTWANGLCEVSATRGTMEFNLIRMALEGEGGPVDATGRSPDVDDVRR